MEGTKTAPILKQLVELDFRVAAAWIEDEQNRAVWEQGILHGFRMGKEDRHGKRRGNRP